MMMMVAMIISYNNLISEKATSRHIFSDTLFDQTSFSASESKKHSLVRINVACKGEKNRICGMDTNSDGFHSESGHGLNLFYIFFLFIVFF